MSELVERARRRAARNRKMGYPVDAALEDALATALEEAERALDQITEQQPKTLAMIESNGFVFATPLGKPDDERSETEMWEKLAFSIYTDLCQIDVIARAALHPEESPVRSQAGG